MFVKHKIMIGFLTGHLTAARGSLIRGVFSGRFRTVLSALSGPAPHGLDHLENFPAHRGVGNPVIAPHQFQRFARAKPVFVRWQRRGGRGRGFKTFKEIAGVAAQEPGKLE